MVSSAVEPPADNWEVTGSNPVPSTKFKSEVGMLKSGVYHMCSEHNVQFPNGAKCPKCTTVDDYRKDLKFQLETPDEIDWDYFVETAIAAQKQANKEHVNMNWENNERTR